METGAAVTEARKMKNHFKAFERLEEVLIEVHAAKGVLSNLKSESTRVNEEIKKAKSTLKSREGALAAFLSMEITKRKKSTEESLAVQAGLQESLGKQKADFKAEMTKARKSADTRLAAKEAELEELNKRLEVARASLGNLQTAITKLQTQVGGLQPEV